MAYDLKNVFYLGFLHEYANGAWTGKDSVQPIDVSAYVDPIFVWFKRHHGARWQEKLRQYMYNDVKHWKIHEFWRCECPNVGTLGNYNHNQTPKCHKCGTWKNTAMRRIHE